MKSLLARLVLAGWAFAPAVFAAGEAQPARRFAAPDVAAATTQSAAGGIGQMVFGLVVVLAAVFVVAFVARRLRASSSGGANGIEVLAQAALGAKEKAVIVRVDGERLLLGVAAGQVSLLKTLSAESAPSPPAVTSSQIQNFAALLRKSLGK
jgi:flagellar protein FliO/FliZ